MSNEILNPSKQHTKTIQQWVTKKRSAFEKNLQEQKEKLLTDNEVLKSNTTTDFPVIQPQWHTPRSDNHAAPHTMCINYNYDPGFNSFVHHNQNSATQRPQHQKSYWQPYYYPTYPTMPNTASHTLPEPDMICHILQVQDIITEILHHVQQWCSTDRYLDDLMTCISDNLWKISLWLLSIEKVAKQTDKNPEGICFPKPEHDLLKFLYFLPLQTFSCHFL